MEAAITAALHNNFTVRNILSLVERKPALTNHGCSDTVLHRLQTSSATTHVQMLHARSMPC